MKMLRGTVFGGIAFFLLGWLIYGLLMMNFSMANTNQCANKPMGEMIWWAMIVSNFISAFLLTLILKWSGAKGIMDSLKIGTIFGLLYASALDLGFWSMTIMFNNFWALIVDVAETTVLWALVGLVIVLLWGKDKTT
jgi:hypothetical protein